MPANHHFSIFCSTVQHWGNFTFIRNCWTSLIKLRNLDIFLRFLSSLYIGKCPSYQNPNDGWVHMERVFIVKVLASLEFSSTSLAKWGFITSMGRSSQLEDSLGSMELSPRHLLYAGFFCYAGFSLILRQWNLVETTQK